MGTNRLRLAVVSNVSIGLYLNEKHLERYFPYGFWLALHVGLPLCDWGNPFTVHLVAPTFPQVMHWPDVWVLILTIFPAEKLGDILRSLLALTIGLVALAMSQVSAKDQGARSWV